jgi:hypothetical protein
MNARESSSTRASPRRFGRLTGRVAEGERDAADDSEDDEVQPVVLDVRVELLAKE